MSRTRGHTFGKNFPRVYPRESPVLGSGYVAQAQWRQGVLGDVAPIDLRWTVPITELFTANWKMILYS